MLKCILEMMKCFFLPKPNPKYGKLKLSGLIRKFVLADENLDPWAWDDFMCANLDDPYETLIQKLAVLVEINYPASRQTEWCNKDGGDALLNLARAIQLNRVPFPPTEEE